MSTTGNAAETGLDDALGSFLQSIVLVDNHAALASATETHSEGDPQGLNAKAIVDSFADLGMVCGVLRPAENEDIVQRTTLAARRADVIVLDWVLKDGDELGDQAIAVLEALLKGDDAAHMLRFFAIYTGEPGLVDIAARCKQLLDSLDDENSVEPFGEFTFRRGPTTLSVFAKDTIAELLLTDELSERVTAPADLPKKLLAEYRKCELGMIASVALRSVAQVRWHTHQLLARFPSSIDPAFLWHRARMRNVDDATALMIDVIGAEITELIDDGAVRNEISTAAITNWIKLREEMLVRSGQFETGKSATIEHICSIVEVGHPASGLSLPAFTGKGYKSGLPIFADSKEKMEASHEQLAMLVTLMKPYDVTLPYLQAGVIVERDGELFLCVQPLCDCVRLGDAISSFPFLRLTKRDGNGPFNILVPLDAGVERYMIPDSPSDLVMVAFKANGYVVQAINDGGRIVFEASDEKAPVANNVAEPQTPAPAMESGSQFLYRATLRPLKAVSVVTRLASQLVRTGVDDPEWLLGWENRN